MKRLAAPGDLRDFVTFSTGLLQVKASPARDVPSLDKLAMSGSAATPLLDTSGCGFT